MSLNIIAVKTFFGKMAKYGSFTLILYIPVLLLSTYFKLNKYDFMISLNQLILFVAFIEIVISMSSQVFMRLYVQWSKVIQNVREGNFEKIDIDTSLADYAVEKGKQIVNVMVDKVSKSIEKPKVILKTENTENKEFSR